MNRESIYAGLFSQLSDIPELVTQSRLLKHWTDVMPELQPALYQSQIREVAITQTGLPTKWELHLQIYIYVRTDGETPPSMVINPIIDAVTAIVQARHVINGRNNLGGIENVEWARVDGAIETDEGVLGNQAVAIIPIIILATD